MAKTHYVEPEIVQSLLAKGAIILDVRTPAEYSTGHIRTARNMSIDNVNFISIAQGLEKKATYVVHCSANVPKGRTDRAIEQLKALGFEDLNSMTGGIVAWKEKGFAVGVYTE